MSNPTAQLLSECSSPNPSLDKIKALIKAGADPNATSAGEEGQKLTPLWHLIYSEHTELAAQLINYCYKSGEYKGRKLNLEVRDDEGEGTTYLCLACFEGAEGLAKALVENGAEMESRDNGSLQAIDVVCGGLEGWFGSIRSDLGATETGHRRVPRSLEAYPRLGYDFSVTYEVL
jgi:ankyrin repeat protein